jgi:hypothetical protein
LSKFLEETAAGTAATELVTKRVVPKKPSGLAGKQWDRFPRRSGGKAAEVHPEFTMIGAEDSNLAIELTSPVRKLAADLVKSTAVEQALYNAYKTAPQLYMYKLALISAMLDPKHYIGQFAKMFREKVQAGAYPPERIAKLDLEEFLPELFMGKGTDRAILELQKELNKSIGTETLQLIDNVQAQLNPSIRRRGSIEGYQVPEGRLATLAVDNIKEQCSNPVWDVPAADIIICKTAGKFYCLNVQVLLDQMASGQEPYNYFTKQPLSSEIADNLRKRSSNKSTSSARDKKFAEKSIAKLATLLRELESGIPLAKTTTLETLPSDFVKELRDVADVKAFLRAEIQTIQAENGLSTEDDLFNEDQDISKAFEPATVAAVGGESLFRGQEYSFLASLADQERRAINSLIAKATLIINNHNATAQARQTATRAMENANRLSEGLELELTTKPKAFLARNLAETEAAIRKATARSMAEGVVEGSLESVPDIRNLKLKVEAIKAELQRL